MIWRIVLFLILNFIALAIGGLFTNTGANSDWYAELAKAPWTPPGWVFGVAWATIMVFYAFYMAYLWTNDSDKKTITWLFILQWCLNILWNPIFFYYHNVVLGLIVITALTLLVGIFLFKYWSDIQLKSILILPYFIWLIIATSLNAYILFYN